MKAKLWVSVLFVAVLLAFSAAAVNIKSLGISPSTGNAPLDVKFAASVEGTGSYSYSWDLGDGFTSNKASFSHTYSDAGDYAVKLDVTDLGDNSTDSKTGTITANKPESLSVSINANPQMGNAPLNVAFVIAVSGEEPLTYSWDFNADSTEDSKNKNPTYTYSTPGVYEASVKVTDAAGTSKTEKIKIVVTKFDPKIKISSYSPKSFKLGNDNSLALILENTGSEYLNNIDAKIVTDNIAFKDSTSIASLAPNDKDSLTIKFSAAKAGNYDFTIKILGKNFNIPIEIIDESKIYNASELSSRLNALKSQMDSYEADYLKKKADEYLVGDIYDSIKSVKNSIQAAQQNLLSGKLSDVSTALALMDTQSKDIADFLKQAQKPKKSFFDLIKENALLITTLAAALAAMGGIMARLKASARRVGETVGGHIKTISTRFKPAQTEVSKQHKPKKKAKKK